MTLGLSLPRAGIPVGPCRRAKGCELKNAARGRWGCCVLSDEIRCTIRGARFVISRAALEKGKFSIAKHESWRLFTFEGRVKVVSARGWLCYCMFMLD